MAIPNGKITLQDVYDNFNKYNFIIYTKQGTIDTSKYNAVHITNETLVQEATRKVLILYRVTPDSKYLERTGDINGHPDNQTYSIEYFTEIKENTVHSESTNKVKQYNTIDSITIKSIRGEKGFLFNQLETKKL